MRFVFWLLDWWYGKDETPKSSSMSSLGDGIMGDENHVGLKDRGEGFRFRPKVMNMGMDLTTLPKDSVMMNLMDGRALPSL